MAYIVVRLVSENNYIFGKGTETKKTFYFKSKGTAVSKYLILYGKFNKYNVELHV
jgi:hypothetical protein